jgi:hypothetical protein
MMSEEEYREMEYDMLRDLIEILMRVAAVFVVLMGLYIWVAT